MVTAIFRFEDTLNAFLAPAQRGRAIAQRCADTATVKHAIEVLGVPHTEIGRVLVNGKTVALDHRMHEGDDVNVYSVAPGPGSEAEGSSGGTAFIADSHLGGLARLLRMAGFDTLYDNHFHDSDIQAIAAGQGRVVLTRDRELLKRRAIGHGCYVRALEPAAQLREVARRFGLARTARPFSLCLHCNAPLRPVDKEAVRSRVPEMAWSRHDRFNTCDVCRRVFWAGTHWQRMRKLLQEALRDAETGGVARGLPRHSGHRAVPAAMVHADGLRTSGGTGMQDDSQRRNDERHEPTNLGSGSGQGGPDEDLRAKVYGALSLRGIDLGDVSIRTENGCVILDGSVSDLQMKQRMEEIAMECEGVQRIQNNLGLARAAGGGRDTEVDRDVGTGMTGQLGQGTSRGNVSGSGSGEASGSGPSGSSGTRGNG
jgi:uncharacterized protein with PIN domain